MGIRVARARASAAGRASAYSDLDLAIDAGGSLTLDEARSWPEVFSDSDLQYRVDIVDWNAIDDRFRRIITDQLYRSRIAACGNLMRLGSDRGA